MGDLRPPASRWGPGLAARSIAKGGQGWRPGEAVGMDIEAHHSLVVALVHPESHFTEKEAKYLRARSYQRLRRHWQFINELILFEIDHKASFGVHVYAPPSDVLFLQAVAIYHPETIERSFAHDGSGDEPGYKDRGGNWDRRPHRNRLIRVDAEALAVWRDILEAPDVSRVR